jgi:hypothetical protein
VVNNPPIGVWTYLNTTTPYTVDADAAKMIVYVEISTFHFGWFDTCDRWCRGLLS